MKKNSVLKIKAVVLIIGLLAFLSPAYGAIGEAGQPGEFLDWGAGARALGMGNAYTGLADDASAIYWNPAGLAKVTSNQLMLLYSVLFEDTTFDFGSFCYPMLNVGTFGVGAAYLSSTGFEGRDQNNNVTGAFDEGDLAAFLSFGTNVYENFNLGITLKLINQSIGNYNNSGFGIDLGAMYTLFDSFTLGAVAQNLLAPEITLESTADIYPLAFKFGGAFKIFDGQLTLTADADKIGDADFEFAGGAEYRPFKIFAIRCGINDTEMTAGAGFYYKGIGLDYAIATQSLGISNRFSFSWSFGSFDLEVECLPKVFSPYGTTKNVDIKLKGAGKYGITKWNLIIKDSNGEVVKKYGDKGMPPDSVLWNGKNMDNIFVNDGEYTVELQLTDKIGDEDTISDTVKIDTRIIEPEVIIDMGNQ